MVNHGPAHTDSREPEYDCLIIGSGVCGLYQLYRLLQQDLRVVAVEAHGDVGGTWYKNRYPGCRFDSESYTYAYSFSKELMQEWNWSERFAAQPETLSYLNYVADKFNLRDHIQFNTKVVSAHYDEQLSLWRVTFGDGRVTTTRFLLPAMGLLSAPTLPRIPGRDSYRGVAVHTYDWPDAGIDLRGKRVAVIGTGSTGVQVISSIAKDVASLTIFQRDPNWCAPLHNGPIDAAEMAQIKDSYDEIFKRCFDSPNGFIHAPERRRTFDVPEDERLAHWEELYASPGFGIWLGNYFDTLMEEKANAELSRFIEAKIRARINDPAVADKLIPTDHGFGTKRVPLETGYFEIYNQPNVELVDINTVPIERITPTGVVTSEREYEFDVMIYATGFDAVTGPFDRIDFVGLDGLTLKEHWKDGPVTCLGIMTTHFPNLLTVVGPQSGSVAANFPRGIEDIVQWMSSFIEMIFASGYIRVEPTEEAQQAWFEHVDAVSKKVLFSKSKSWFTGYNTNLDRDQRPRHMIYTGGAIRYRRRLTEEVANGYSSFVFTRSDGSQGQPEPAAAIEA